MILSISAQCRHIRRVTQLHTRALFGHQMSVSIYKNNLGISDEGIESTWFKAPDHERHHTDLDNSDIQTPERVYQRHTDSFFSHL
jgi:hypothetical protein